jgi:hypothetical protein
MIIKFELINPLISVPLSWIKLWESRLKSSKDSNERIWEKIETFLKDKRWYWNMLFIFSDNVILNRKKWWILKYQYEVKIEKLN